MAEEWGPWIEHDGQGCPVVGQVVHLVIGVDPATGADPANDPDGWVGCVEILGPFEAIAIAAPSGSWSWSQGWYPVIRYRVRRPRGMRALDLCLAQLPADRRDGDPVSPRSPERVDA